MKRYLPLFLLAVLLLSFLLASCGESGDETTPPVSELIAA